MQYRAFWRPLDRAELPLLEAIRHVRRMGALHSLAGVVTRAAEHGLLWYLIAGLAAWRDQRRREQWIAAAGKVALVYGINTLLKLVARRQRPPVAELGTPTALSFPSSHAATSFAAARLYGDLVPAARPLLLAAATGVSSTRLHFMVHYPSDIAAGALLGDMAAQLLSSQQQEKPR